MTHPRRRRLPIWLYIGRDEEFQYRVTPDEFKVLRDAYAADLGGPDALPRRGARGGAAPGPLPEGWWQPYWHLIDDLDLDAKLPLWKRMTKGVYWRLQTQWWLAILRWRKWQMKRMEKKIERVQER